jgi:DNA-damage-inducible protein J
MTAKTSMLHVRIDDAIKAKASDTLASFGLTVSDAVRILLTRVVSEGALPVGLTVDEASYDKWFRGKVLEALESTGPTISHEDAMSQFRGRLKK